MNSFGQEGEDCPPIGGQTHIMLPGLTKDMVPKKARKISRVGNGIPNRIQFNL